MDGVWCLDFIPNTNMVVSGSKDDYLKVWDVVSGECLHTLEGHSSWVSCVTAIDSKTIVSGSNDKSLKFWKLSLDKGRSYGPSNRHLAQPECIAISGCGGLVASGGPDAVKLWDPVSGKCKHSTAISTSCLTFISQDKFMIVGCKNGDVVLFDIANEFKHLRTIQEHKDRVTYLLPLNRGCFLSSSIDSTVRVWDEDYKCFILLHHTAGVTCIACYEDENIAASGSVDGSICLWKLSDIKCIGTMRGHSKTVNCLKFNRNGTNLISGSDDTSACVWSIAEMHCVHKMTYTDSIKALCITDSGVLIAGAHCSQNQLKSWNTNNGKFLHNFVGHSHAVMCMLLVDDCHILTGSRDGTIRVWNLKTSKLLCSFDLQSQVKHICLYKLSTTGSYLVASTTKSGPIAFFQLKIVQ